jgi:hypothetical protein
MGMLIPPAVISIPSVRVVKVLIVEASVVGYGNQSIDADSSIKFRALIFPCRVINQPFLSVVSQGGEGWV